MVAVSTLYFDDDDDIMQISLKGESSWTGKDKLRLSRRNSWGEIDLDLDDEEDGEDKSKKDERTGMSRRSSWDDLDLSEHMKKNEEVITPYVPSTSEGHNIVLVGRLEDTEKFLLSSPAPDKEMKTRKVSKSLSNKLGLMSPFGKKGFPKNKFATMPNTTAQLAA